MASGHLHRQDFHLLERKLASLHRHRQAFGGLKPSVRRLLERASEDAGERRILRTRPVTRVTAGTVLIREWQGKSHHVTVFDRGVLYRKKNYRSLSQVACIVTGCRWSGPRFFGLKARSKEGSRGGTR
ncbi:MAG: DUF2924 domain-containing protein [Candidatus Binataceae bacterium]